MDDTSSFRNSKTILKSAGKNTNDGRILSRNEMYLRSIKTSKTYIHRKSHKMTNSATVPTKKICSWIQLKTEGKGRVI